MSTQLVMQANVAGNPCGCAFPFIQASEYSFFFIALPCYMYARTVLLHVRVHCLATCTRAP